MIEMREPRGVRQLRHEQRMRVLLSGELQVGGATIACRVHDISRGGACVETDFAIRVGQAVQLVRGNIRARGTVAWVARRRLGIRFEGPIRATDLLVQMSESRRARAPAGETISVASAPWPTR